MIISIDMIMFVFHDLVSCKAELSTNCSMEEYGSRIPDRLVRNIIGKIDSYYSSRNEDDIMGEIQKCPDNTICVIGTINLVRRITGKTVILLHDKRSMVDSWIGEKYPWTSVKAGLFENDPHHLIKLYGKKYTSLESMAMNLFDDYASNYYYCTYRMMSYLRRNFVGEKDGFYVVKSLPPKLVQAKSAFQFYTQKYFRMKPKYEILKKGKDHAPIFTCSTRYCLPGGGCLTEYAITNGKRTKSEKMVAYNTVMAIIESGDPNVIFGYKYHNKFVM